MCEWIGDECLCCLVRTTELLAGLGRKEKKKKKKTFGSVIKTSTKQLWISKNILGYQHLLQSPSGIDVTGASVNVCLCFRTVSSRTRVCV